MSLKRPKQPMPEFVKNALEQYSLINEYESRPPYQLNDYLWWINDAKRQETKDKRLNQMLDELRAGNLYMKMSWSKK